eukprot:TRINITY_DN4188_c0_g1_i8.p1 TRINITY_DN4188_c0_g1~~TRINITY_DN4188_c0_g1_i8.p1  ORF type:complete len:255 (-),score=71.32 TRINITY_DN4188_c0_g1_i8:265-927(-)
MCIRDRYQRRVHGDIQKSKIIQHKEMEGKHDNNELGDQDPKAVAGSNDELDDGDNGEGEGSKKGNDEVKDLENSIGESIQQNNEVDMRSIYVKNVDYMSTREEVMKHFESCGKINRVTICTDKMTGHPKGFAYIEFADRDAVESAKMLDGSLFRGRQISVLPKRTNLPKMGKRRPRGSGFPPRGAGGFGRGGFYMRGYNMFAGPPRGFRGKFRPFQHGQE